MNVKDKKTGAVVRMSETAGTLAIKNGTHTAIKPKRASR